MYYTMGNFVPWREAAWTVLFERIRLLADRCAGMHGVGFPPEVAAASGTLGHLAERRAAHLPAAS